MQRQRYVLQHRASLVLLADLGKLNHFRTEGSDRVGSLLRQPQIADKSAAQSMIHTDLACTDED